MDLIWFDPGMMPNLRRDAALRPLIEELHNKSPSSGYRVLSGQSTKDVEESREICEILSNARPLRVFDIDDALCRGAYDDGRFVPPWVVLHGSLAVHLDPIEELKATVALATPVAGIDEVRDSLVVARSFLEVANSVSLDRVAQDLANNIRRAVARHHREVRVEDLQRETDRALVERRCYRQRALFGSTQLWAALHLDGSKEAVHAYVPARVANELPLFRSFDVRLLAELHVAVSESDRRTSLRVVALARDVTVPARTLRSGMRP